MLRKDHPVDRIIPALRMDAVPVAIRNAKGHFRPLAAVHGNGFAAHAAYKIRVPQPAIFRPKLIFLLFLARRSGVCREIFEHELWQ